MVTRQRQNSCPCHRIRSIKAGLRPILCDGPLVADAAMMFEFDVTVSSLCEHPLRVHGPIGARPHVTLDLGVTHRGGGETFYGICRERDLDRSDDGLSAPSGWSQLEGLAAASGHRCELLMDTQIESCKTRIRNARFLLPFAWTAYERSAPDLVDEVLDALHDRRAASLDELTRAVAGASVQHLVPVVALLLHDGRCEAALDTEPFTMATPIKKIDSE